MADQDSTTTDHSSIASEAEALAGQVTPPAEAAPSEASAQAPSEPTSEASSEVPSEAPAQDKQDTGLKLLADLAPEFEVLREKLGAAVIESLKEVGNKGLEAIEKYGPEEFKKLEGANQAVFTAIHNKLAGLIASLEGIFSKS